MEIEFDEYLVLYADEMQIKFRQTILECRL